MKNEEMIFVQRTELEKLIDDKVRESLEDFFFTNQDKVVYSIPEAALKIDMTPSTAYRKIEEGILKTTDDNKITIWEINRYLQRLRNKQTKKSSPGK